MAGSKTLSSSTSFQLSQNHNRLPSASSFTKTINFQRSMSFPNQNQSKFKIQATSAETLPRFNAKKSKNFYEILRVKETASVAEIKTAYRSLAKRIHPDAATSESDSSEFIEIHEAYATLSDPTARARYDFTMRLVGMKRWDDGIGNPIFVGRVTRRWETDQCW